MPVLMLPLHSSLEATSGGFFVVHADCLAEHLFSVDLHLKIIQADST